MSYCYIFIVIFTKLIYLFFQINLLEIMHLLLLMSCCVGIALSINIMLPVNDYCDTAGLPSNAATAAFVKLSKTFKAVVNDCDEAVPPSNTFVIALA